MILQTNAKSLPELDIAIAELGAFQPMGFTFQRPTYETQGRCTGDLGPSIDSVAGQRLAMFDYDVTDPDTPMPTVWAKIRGHRYDKRLDHSTHNLFPFTGKLEPRLARACINLAIGPKENVVVCDPFCGSGTVLLEANLMWIRTVGFDLDPFAIWLTETKLCDDERTFVRRWEELENYYVALRPPMPQQWASYPPTDAPTVLTVGNAIQRLLDTAENDFDAIVTSPPYFDALNYNDRHALIRKALKLPAPEQTSLGIGMTIAEYHASVVVIAREMYRTVKPGGRIVIVSAAYRGVDTPAIYETALTTEGGKVCHRLTRPYAEPILGVIEDVILVVEKR